MTIWRKDPVRIDRTFRTDPDLSMNLDSRCVFIFDSEFHLLSRSENCIDNECLLNIFIFEDNQLIGIEGVPDSLFREQILEADKKNSTFFMRPKGRHRLKQEILVKVSPLFGKSPLSIHSGPSHICIDLQTVDIYYSTTSRRLADRFGLTATEKLVLSYLLNGMTSREIKEKMNFGEPTLRSHQQRIRSKFGENSVMKTILSALKIENNVGTVIEMDDWSFWRPAVAKYFRHLPNSFFRHFIFRDGDRDFEIFCQDHVDIFYIGAIWKLQHLNKSKDMSLK